MSEQPPNGAGESGGQETQSGAEAGATGVASGMRGDRPRHDSLMARALAPEILELVRAGQYRELRASLRDIPPADIADLLDELEPADAAVAYRLLRRDDAADVFAYLDAERQEQLIDELGADAAMRIVEAMDPDDRAAMLDELPGEVSTRLMEAMSPKNRRVTEEIMGYPPESVGRRMTPDYVRLRRDWTIAQALEHIRRNGRDAETIHWVYVIDERGVLIDDLHIRRLLLAEPSAVVESIMDSSYVALSATDDQEEAVRLMARYDRTALPVVDARGVLVGIVTFDDVADIAELEATEDIHKLGGVRALDTSYREAKTSVLVRKRTPWLLVLVVVNLISSGIIAAFEETLEAAIALAFFLPLLIDSGGNVGSQGATLMVRALATGDLKLSQWFKAARKELLVGVLMGAAMGVASAALGLIRGGIEIGLVVGLSMFCIVFIANLLGALLPFILTKLKIDPAVASSPLITTIADSVGLLIYFSIATVLLTAVTPPPEVM